MTARAKGIDVSTWQHPGQAPIDWEAVADAGVTFVIIKATQGVAWVNPWFEEDYAGAFGAGLLVGAYHFFEAGPAPEEQAKLFVSTLVGKRLDLHAWLDFEPAPVTNWTAAGWVNAFLEAAKDGRPGAGLYCDQSWWAELASANVSPPALWLAAPSLTEAPAGATLWQVAPQTVPGVPAEIDVDWLVGTRGVNLPTAPAKPLALHPEPVTLAVAPGGEVGAAEPGTEAGED